MNGNANENANEILSRLNNPMQNNSMQNDPMQFFGGQSTYDKPPPQ